MEHLLKYKALSTVLHSDSPENRVTISACLFGARQTQLSRARLSRLALRGIVRTRTQPHSGEGQAQHRRLAAIQP